MPVLNIFNNIKILEFDFFNYTEIKGFKKIHLPLLETIKVYDETYLSWFCRLTSLKNIYIKISTVEI
jgi:hypothetical protein